MCGKQQVDESFSRIEFYNMHTYAYIYVHMYVPMFLNLFIYVYFTSTTEVQSVNFIGELANCNLDN